MDLFPVGVILGKMVYDFDDKFDEKLLTEPNEDNVYFDASFLPNK